jgi:hypothetical protein
MIWPWKSWTIPTITSATANSHKRNRMPGSPRLAAVPNPSFHTGRRQLGMTPRSPFALRQPTLRRLESSKTDRPIHRSASRRGTRGTSCRTTRTSGRRSVAKGLPIRLPPWWQRLRSDAIEMEQRHGRAGAHLESFACTTLDGRHLDAPARPSPRRARPNASRRPRRVALPRVNFETLTDRCETVTFHSETWASR